MKNYSVELRLIDTYGQLLSPKKLSYVEDYYYDDLSLSEIAEKHGVSRATIHESIKEGIKELNNFEKKLHYIKKQNDRIDFIKKNISDQNLIDEYLNLELGVK